MRALAVLGLSYLLMGLETTLLYQAGVGRLAPDLGALGVVFAAANLSLVVGAVTAMMIGFLSDAFAMGSPVGLYAEVYVLLFLIFRMVFRKLALKGMITSLMVGFLAPLLCGVLAMFIGWIFDQVFDGYAVAVRAFVPNALVTAPLAPVVFFLYERLDRALTRRRGGSVFFN